MRWVAGWVGSAQDQQDPCSLVPMLGDHSLLRSCCDSITPFHFHMHVDSTSSHSFGERGIDSERKNPRPGRRTTRGQVHLGIRWPCFASALLFINRKQVLSSRSAYCIPPPLPRMYLYTYKCTYREVPLRETSDFRLSAAL